jgi:hypothetical protein
VMMMNWLTKWFTGICITSGCNKWAMRRYRDQNGQRYSYAHCEDHPNGWLAFVVAENLKARLAAGRLSSPDYETSHHHDHARLSPSARATRESPCGQEASGDWHSA